MSLTIYRVLIAQRSTIRVTIANGTNPWGNERAIAQQHGNLDRLDRIGGKEPTVEAVGQFEAGKSFFALYDMAGNAEE
jgi:formylglycine-generating enzyme required for sulfatase activity